jgi:hypothetical protein
MKIPQLSAKTEPFLWGAAAGAIALAVIGFNWGGWVTGGTAERLAVQQSEQAMVAALVPICVSQFQKNPEASGRLAALKETKSWEQGDFVSAGGWATMPGIAAAEPNRQVAQACAEALTKVVQ